MNDTELRIAKGALQRAKDGFPLNSAEAHYLAVYVDKLCGDLDMSASNLRQDTEYIKHLEETIRINKITYRKDLEQIASERDTAVYGLAYERGRHKAAMSAKQALCDKLEAQFAEVASDLYDLEDHIAEELPYTFDDGEDPPNEAGPHECISYARDEIKDLKNQVTKLTEKLTEALVCPSLFKCHRG